jgi:hypothetical protein
MTERNRFQSGSTQCRSTTYTYGVSYGTSDLEGVSNRCAGLHGRARAAVEAEAIRATLERLAAEIPVKDFTWLRLAVDAAFDELLFGDPID